MARRISPARTLGHKVDAVEALLQDLISHLQESEMSAQLDRLSAAIAKLSSLVDIQIVKQTTSDAAISEMNARMAVEGEDPAAVDALTDRVETDINKLSPTAPAAPITPPPVEPILPPVDIIPVPVDVVPVPPIELIPVPEPVPVPVAG